MLGGHEIFQSPPHWLDLDPPRIIEIMIWSAPSRQTPRAGGLEIVANIASAPQDLAPRTGGAGTNRSTPTLVD